MPLFSFPVTRLPVELLEHIADIAIASGAAKIKDMTLVCPRWKLRYQHMLFRTVRLDPFNDGIFDLGHSDYKHLIPYIKELYVVDRSDSSTPPNYDRDLSPRFTNFLLHAEHAASLLLRDDRIQWGHISHKTIDAFCTVFRRNSFRSLEISNQDPVPSWMLLHGVCVASDLTFDCIGPIIPPLISVDLASYQCSLTRLVLFGNISIKQATKFCLQHEGLANELLRHVVDLVLDYTYPSPWDPYPERMLEFLAPQLKALDLRVKYSTPAPSVLSTVPRLGALQHLAIYLDSPQAFLAGEADTLKSAEKYMELVLATLPSPSAVKSISLRINDRTGLNSGADTYRWRFDDFLGCIHDQVCYPEQWPCLTSINVLMNFNDVYPLEPFHDNQDVVVQGMHVDFLGYIQVNRVRANDFGVSVAPYRS